jgi:hypothetical protein
VTVCGRLSDCEGAVMDTCTAAGVNVENVTVWVVVFYLLVCQAPPSPTWSTSKPNCSMLQVCVQLWLNTLLLTDNPGKTNPQHRLLSPHICTPAPPKTAEHMRGGWVACDTLQICALHNTPALHHSAVTSPPPPSRARRPPKQQSAGTCGKCGLSSSCP